MQIILETHSERYRILEFYRNHFVFLALDPCSSDPCQNGVCNSTAVGYECTCYPDYSGTNCDKGLYTILANYERDLFEESDKHKKTYLPDLETKITLNLAL